jgi:8-oxo-dGTP diphosphatase
MNVTSNAILIKNNKILIGERPETKKTYAGFWDVFGGHVEDGETPEKAMKREVKEELDIEVVEYKFFYLMKNDLDPTSKKTYDHYFFIVTKWEGLIRNLDTEALEWVSEKDLNKFKFSSGLKDILGRAFEVI